MCFCREKKKKHGSFSWSRCTERHLKVAVCWSWKDGYRPCLFPPAAGSTDESYRRGCSWPKMAAGHRGVGRVWIKLLNSLQEKKVFFIFCSHCLKSNFQFRFTNIYFIPHQASFILRVSTKLLSSLISCPSPSSLLSYGPSEGPRTRQVGHYCQCSHLTAFI